MSDEIQSQEGVSEEEHLNLASDLQDVILSSFVDQANKNDLQFDVTLMLKGMIVCGTVIGQKEYLLEVSKQFRGANGNAGEAFAEAFENLSETEVPKNAPVGLIHLKDARVFVPNQPPLPSNAGLLWRGSLASIDGWSLGALQWNS